MIKDNLQEKINKALKQRDELTVMTLRMLSTALTNAEIAKKRQALTEQEEIDVVKKEAKKRKDAIELYEIGGAMEKAEKEKKELEILKTFLPEEMPDEELEKIVDEAISTLKPAGMQDIGKVIGFVMGKVKGQADGSRVSVMIKNKLS